MGSKVSAFKCKRCGSCCQWPGYVRIKEDEPDRIAGFLNMDPGEFIREYTVMTLDRQDLSLMENKNGSCVFYSDNPAKCKIYKVRPLQCEKFPANWDFPDWKDFCKGENNG